MRKHVNIAKANDNRICCSNTLNSVFMRFYFMRF